MSVQFQFSSDDIHRLPFKEGDELMYKGKKVTITNIGLREFNESVNDIIVSFTNTERSDYTFHDDRELTRLDGTHFRL